MTTPAQADRAEQLRQAVRLKRAAGTRASELPPRPSGETARLGDGQRGLWLLHRLDPSSPAYHLTSAFRARGALDAGRLERAFDRVVSRHRILRSTFRARSGGVAQVVHPHAPVAVERIAAEDGEAEAEAVRAARAPFDLETGPLVRLLLVEEPSGESLVVLVLHHVLADERSLRIFWRELAGVYRGRAADAGEPPQYDDYVYWLARRAPDDRAAELDAWRRRLDPLPDELQLPFERRVPTSAAGAGRGARGRLLRRTLGPGARHGVQRLAAAAGTTPFSVFAFAFRLLLDRYTGGRRVAFAAPASTRSHPATAEMIGYFLNPVVIPIAIDEERSVERALDDFSRRARDCLAHASVPFDALVEALSLPCRRDRHPIFQALFVHQETPPPPELEGVRLEPIILDLGESKFDLTLFASEALAAGGPVSVEIAVEYRTDRFDEVWMRRLLGHYEALLEGLAADLERPVSEVPMLLPEEVERLRAAAQGPPLEVPATALLPRQILDRARRTPRAPAVVGGGEAWAYSELERAALRVARELLRRGVGPGDRVGLFLDRSPLLVAGLLGCHFAGAAYVPLDPAHPAARNRDVLGDAEVAAVVTRAALRDRLGPGPWPAVDVDDLTAAGAEGAGEEESLPEPGAGDPAYLLYTSGSTGRPKGVVVTHGNLRASTVARSCVYGPRSGEEVRFLLVPSVAFDSSVAGIFWTLSAGATLVIPTDDEARDPRSLARLIGERRVTHVLLIPSLYAYVLEAGGERLRGLETVVVAGEICPPGLVEEHFRRLSGTRLFNEYGPTEATVWATVAELGPEDARGPIPIGRPIPGVRLEVLDPAGRRVPAGVPGEGWISGPTVAPGYWRREESAERFVRRAVAGDPAEPEARWYRTGDRLAWTLDGRLEFLGRVDRQIKLRGVRIEPGEVEAALLELPEVREAAVVARRGELVAFVEAAGTTASSALPAWRERLARRLPEPMVPGRFVALSELPRLPNGKVDRGRLRETTLDAETALEDDPAAGAEPPTVDEREQALLALWQGLLGRTAVSPTDNFFRLGGHSLLAVEMAAAIEGHFGVALAPAEVFQFPTVRELARRIGRRGGPDGPSYAHLFPILPGGREAPFVVAVPHFFIETFASLFRGERPVYGLRGVGLRPEGNRGRWRTMRDLGEELVDEVRRRFGDRACILAGYSFGATMAVEAVRLMEERGIDVERLVLIAPMPVDRYRLGPFRLPLDGLRSGVEELTPAQALARFARAHHPFGRRLYRRAWRLLAVGPWRRLLCRIGRLRRRAGLPLGPRILHADVRLERFRLHAGYRPGIVETPTVVFNAAEPEPETDAAATWRPWFAGPYTVHPIPDPHLGGAELQAAKELIRRHLREAGDA